MATTDIDELGDLVLIVGPDKARFKVSSHAMRLVSDVWRAMLTGPFREANSNEINLEYDDPAAMEILLLLAHLRFAKVPKDLEWNTLISLTILCDKYNAAAVMKASKYGAEWLAVCDWSYKDERAWVYWVFG